MNSTVVSNWFGANFEKLHPQLQSLHQKGGTLSGQVNINFAPRFAGFLGRKIAQKLGVPTEPGPKDYAVNITHSMTALHWSRSFDAKAVMNSIFTPNGTYESGYWCETLGSTTLKLSVDILNGAWYWRCVGVELFGFQVPLVFFPKTIAYKKIENEKYVFFVSFSLPLLGELFSYSGALELKSAQG